MDTVWQVVLGSVTVLVSVLVALKIYVERIKVSCKCTTDMSGKTVIITGANTGIGFYTALDLARRHARVILACRNLEKGKAALDKIVSATGNSNVCLKHVSMESLKSVRKFAAEIVAEEKRLDVLINNAGIAGLKETRTEEGLECVMATNYFGPFLLTNLLLDLLEKSAPSRIVNVSSLAHKWCELQLDNLNSEKRFDIAAVYFRSKLALNLFTRELARRLEGTGVVVNCLHTGPTNTPVLKHFMYNSPLLTLLVSPFIKTAEEGAQTTIHCAVSKEGGQVTGSYFSDCSVADDQSSASSRDMGLAKKLWEITEQLTPVTT